MWLTVCVCAVWRSLWHIGGVVCLFILRSGENIFTFFVRKFGSLIIVLIFVQTKEQNAMTTTHKTTNSQTFKMSNGIEYWVAKCEGCGWYVEGKDGYTSEYYSSKKEAISKVKEIDSEIKKGNW